MTIREQIRRTRQAKNIMKELDRVVGILLEELERVEDLYANPRIAEAPATFSGVRTSGNWRLERTLQGTTPYIVISYTATTGTGLLGALAMILLASSEDPNTRAFIGADSRLWVSAHRN